MMLMDITMPSLGADMTEGTLVEWLAKPGDTLNKGDIIAVIETQKGAIDMEVYYAGVVTELLVQPVVHLPVGTVMARMQVEGDAAAAAEITASEGAQVQQAPVVEAPQLEPVIASPRQGVLASPVVRRLAAEQGLNLSNLHGSGPQGAILLRDLASTAKAKTKTPAESMRAAIAAAMQKSKQEIPHYYLSLEVDIANAQAYLQQLNAGREPEQRILLLAVLLKATAKALAKYPQLNGYYQQQQFVPAEAINIANAISLREGGLMLPIIHHVEQQTVDELMQALRGISSRSRIGHLRSSELTGASITVTSIGERGSDAVFGVIYPPQVAIIGFGRPRQAVVVKDGAPAVSELMTITLSADHRVSDGAIGTKFLNSLSNQLQKPEKL